MSNNEILHGTRITWEEFEQQNSLDSPRKLDLDAYPPYYPSYLTGLREPSPFIPDYPAQVNSRELRDPHVRSLLQQNNHDVMLLTVEEAIEVLHSTGQLKTSSSSADSTWETMKSGWVTITRSGPGQFIINYGTNIKDVVTTSMVISMLGGWGVRATVYLNHRGTELIKITGYAGIRKILNAPVFALKNPKVVDVGIGKYGLRNSIVNGARLTFYVAAAFRTLDFILNDETTLARFIGSLATDVAKIGIASLVSWGTGAAIASLTAVVSAPLAVVVVTGLAIALGLNYLDDKFGITDKVVEHIEAAQQDIIEKAQEIEEGLWDLGAMLATGLLNKGKKIFISELRNYFYRQLKKIIPRTY